MFLERIPAVQDVQSAWLILIHCAAARANYLLRVVRPALVRRFAENHDAGLWRCLCQILHIPEDQCEATARTTSTMPLMLGGMGLRSAVRTSVPAHWASWGLHMVHQRHPDVAGVLVDHLEGGADTPYLSAPVVCARELEGVQGFHPPSWTALALGARPPPPEQVFEMDALKGGWHHEASSRVERQFRERIVLPVLTDGERALLRSQSGVGAGVALSTVPCNPLVRIEPKLFRVLLLRRLHLPLTLARRFCRCGRLLDSYGHHRASCARAGVLGRRGYALESAAARVCREAGARVTTNVLVRDLDLRAPEATGARRLEVVADGLPLFTQRWCQLCIATGVLAQVPHIGTALEVARRRKERTYPELVAPWSRCRLVVMANEVGGRCQKLWRFFVTWPRQRHAMSRR